MALEDKKTINLPVEEWENIVSRLNSLEKGGKKRLLSEPDQHEAIMATYKGDPVVGWEDVTGDGRDLKMVIYVSPTNGAKKKEIVDYMPFINNRNEWVKVLITNITKKDTTKVAGQGYKIDAETERITSEIIDYVVTGWDATATVKVISEGELLGRELDINIKYLNP